MIVDLTTGDRARVTMLRQFEVVALKVEEFFPNEHRAQTVTLNARECRKIGNYLEWLAMKIEEEGS